MQFVVVREGVEKMTFTSKKEADAYDKMLDITDLLNRFIDKAELDLSEEVTEKLSFYLATHKDEVSGILKGISPTASQPAKKNKAKTSKVSTDV
nr:YebG family protein [Shewanella sp. NIFS-20-20]